MLTLLACLQVLLKSSNADIRGFSAKVSDFGLSRVEDDDTCATFPFNSCGTAAYVAPEALITTKKVSPRACLGLRVVDDVRVLSYPTGGGWPADGMHGT
jgi:serine/threonine protein kinase